MSSTQLSAVRRLRDGQTIAGTMFRMARHPAMIKMAADAGFDFVMLDFEHGDFNFQTVADLALLGRALNLDVMVRVAELSRAFVSRALDCGVTGVMAPMVESVQQAQQLVQWSKYPPLGQRGLATIGGMSGYRDAPDAVQYMADTNRQVLTIAQIETVAGVAAADGIAATPGIDVLLIGPNDLALSLGKPGELTCPEENDAIEHVAQAAHRHGKVFAMHAGGALLRRWTPRDMRMIMNGMDIKSILTALTTLAAETRELAQQPQLT